MRHKPPRYRDLSSVTRYHGRQTWVRGTLLTRASSVILNIYILSNFVRAFDDARWTHLNMR